MLRKLTVIAIALLALVALASAPASAQYGTDSGVEGAGTDQGTGSGTGTTTTTDDGTLARTGWNVNLPLVVGTSLIVAGGVVLSVRRRRTPTLA